MSSRFEHIQFAALARAGEGLTQWRPLVMGFITMVLCGLLTVASQWLATSVGGMTGVLLFGLCMLVVVVVFFSGISAVGVMLMDKAQNISVRGFSDAAFAGLLCVPKFLGLMLLSLVAALLFYLVAAIIYFICKIPVLGAVLAFVAHPVLIVVASVLIVAWMCVIMPLFAPAVWSGLAFKAALASVIGIARSRLVEVVLMQVVLYFIMLVISGLLLMGLLPAAMSLTGMGASVMGVNLAYLSMMGFGALSNMGAMGSVTGLLLGLGVLLGVVAALLWQVAVMGQNLLYLQANASVDSVQAEAALNGVWNDVRKRAEGAKERAMAAAERAKQMAAEKAQEVAAANEARKAAAAEQAKVQAALAVEREATRLKEEAEQREQAQAAALMDAEQQAQEAAATAALQADAQSQTKEVASNQAPEQTSCTQCHEPVNQTDVFCGNCGTKLK
ncbi:MAG: zinc ribbon domain-containing protein [Comamonas sp.]|uniref:zinc ribbon domain-containing protein n=1 Tax=Comamonas sp. TaxID=34028 RepID=UPI002FC65B69